MGFPGSDFDENAEAKRLEDLAEKNGFESILLDDLVHDTASAMASDINNGGIRDQIEFLLKQNGKDGAKEIERIINEGE